MDEDGYVFIVDRIKDMINASGFKVYPRRIEDALYEHPAVAEVTVIGIPDAYRGEAPKAFVKLKEGKEATAAELIHFLKEKLSKLELPAEIEFRDELPKTLDRQAVQARAPRRGEALIVRQKHSRRRKAGESASDNFEEASAARAGTAPAAPAVS